MSGLGNAFHKVENYAGDTALKVINQQTPTPVAPPAAPTPDDPATQKSMQDAASRERQARGEAANILTGGAGLMSPAPTSRQVLLGS